MEASFAQINRHVRCKNPFFNGRSVSKLKILIGSLSYSRRTSPPPRWSVAMHFERSGAGSRASEVKTTLTYAADQPNQHLEEDGRSYPVGEQVGGNFGIDASVPVEGVILQKKGAKIHDFCFGIPYGGLVLSGGFVGFLFSRNPATLATGVLFGGGLLALSVYSLKVWRQGKSSLPFILGQSALAAVLLWKHFQIYSVTRKLFPTGFYVVVSSAMLCFYTYVMLSGGNPPPKTAKLAASSPS